MTTTEPKPPPPRPQPVRLEKQLELWDVYAIATGATLSSGFFLLPGLAAAGAGAAMPLTYVLAALVLVPGLLSLVELATAMPRAGGLYYFLDRSMGPLVGTIGGFGTWISLILKSTFALVGVDAYLRLFFPGLDMGPVAAGFALAFGVVNLLGAKRTGTFQVFLLVGLLLLLLWFCGFGLLQVDVGRFSPFFGAGSTGIISATGLVVVSYMGLTKVASVAEEVRDPERNLPLGMFLAFGTIVAIYTLGTGVMVGVVGVEVLARDGGDLTPVATVAESLLGHWGAILMTVAAVLAFSSVANAGILSASRYPLAMGRDRLLPGYFSRVGRWGTPSAGIGVTVGLILLSVLLFDPAGVAKLAGAFQLVMFALACLAVTVMRESGIESYDPGFRAPFYPTIQILGILAPFWLVINMGLLPTLFTGGLLTFGAMWYAYYARERVSREGAILHVFERMGRQRYGGLDREFREILKEREPRAADPFEEVLTGALVLDVEEPVEFELLVDRASRKLAEDLDVAPGRLVEGFLEGTRLGVTPVSHGAALPHVRMQDVDHPRLLLARARAGVKLELPENDRSRRPEERLQAVFFLVSPEENPGQHLRILAQIARSVDHEDFMERWLAAGSEEELKETLLLDERCFAFLLEEGEMGSDLVGRKVNEADFPPDTLVAMIRRGDELIIPKGATKLVHGDRLTIIGTPSGIALLRKRYGLREAGPGICTIHRERGH